MKRTLIAITAGIFASALALPAFAQMGDSNPPASSSVNTSSTSESSRTDYRSEQPAPTTNSVEHSEREYRSERTDQTMPAQAEVQNRVVKKESTSTTTESAPPPPVESSTTTTTTHRTESGY
jgi:hypothetical protein